MQTTPDARRFAPATSRNREPIRDVLRTILPAEGNVLEIASGTGEHVTYLSLYFTTLQWQPTDADPDMFPSINAWIEDSAKTRGANNNIHPPLHLDSNDDAWPVEQADAIIAINMIHISPWASCVGLIKGAGRILPTGGMLYLYGPFGQNGRHTSLSNAAFDANLRQRDPLWGVRDLTEVMALAGEHGLVHDQTIPMPANNLSVVFRRV